MQMIRRLFRRRVAAKRIAAIREYSFILIKQRK